MGDGKVGHTLAEQLSRDKHDVVIIDKDEVPLRKAMEHLDVLTIKGNGMRSTILKEAGVADCDILIAATSTDEMNMVCCLTAKKLGAKYTVARIRDPEYARDVSMIKRELDINTVINPEQTTASEISRTLRFPGVINLEAFAKGRVEMVGFVVNEGDIVCGVKLSSLKKRISAAILFCACERDGQVYIPNGESIFQEGDRIYVIGEPVDIMHFFKSIGRNTARMKDAIIVGGGKIAQYLASFLIKTGVRVKLIEVDEERCRELSDVLPEAVVINADGTDLEVLESENFAKADAFVSLTNRDEDNLMIALCAMQNGVSRVVAKSNRQNYIPVVHSLGLDCVVSPKMLTANQIIHLIRGMQNSEGSIMETLYPIVGGQAEAMEFSVTAGTPYLNTQFKSLKMKKNVLIATIVRHGRIIVPTGTDFYEEGDNLVIVTKNLSAVEISDIFE